MSNRYVACTVRQLPPTQSLEAARVAQRVNPENVPPGTILEQAVSDDGDKAAVLITKYWGDSGVHLTVGFLDSPPSPLRRRILAHMNVWSGAAHVEFVETAPSNDAQVRIALGTGGYWSYLGTDILLVPRDQQTMNLEGFTATTSELELCRVVRHETGHTLGFPHEHMRRAIVDRIDRQKAYAYFARTQGWNKRMVDDQVLRSLPEEALIRTPDADETSIMCYPLPDEITVDGSAIPGGVDITRDDADFAASIYPKKECAQCRFTRS
jgi:hypothetical protein